MAGLSTPIAASLSRAQRSEQVMEAVQLDFHVTPLRAERFWGIYHSAVPRVLAYGAKGYTFFRHEEDPDHFVHISFWENGGDFDRFWFSEEMRELRRQMSGLYNQPLLPHRATVLDQA